MLLDVLDFWENERASCFFNRSGYSTESGLRGLSVEVNSLYESCSSDDLVELMDNLKLEKYKVTDECARIFELDAERTFRQKENRKVLYDTLSLVYESIGDYHQGEGFVVALLSLFLEPKEVATLISKLHYKCLEGYFSCKPKNYVRDSKVLMKLLKDLDPKLHDHLDSLIVPEAFVSKWFIGLNIHVLTFKYVVKFMKNLYEEGPIYLFKYGLAFILYHSELLLKSKDVSYILQLLRLDDAVMPSEEEKREEIYKGIFDHIPKVDIDLKKVEEYRKLVTEDMIREEERRKAIEAMLEEDEEIVFSDEE